jgi:hypothetical protein
MMNLGHLYHLIQSSSTDYWAKIRQTALSRTDKQ